MQLHRLVLTDFRNYRRCLWEPSSSVAVLTGRNGSGKTNLLEALSLLAPGRGLRQAPSSQLCRHGADTWGISAHLGRKEHLFKLSTGQEISGSKRRRFLLDGIEIRTQADVAAHCACVWLTPQMDRLFTENASGRRRFLDRLVTGLFPDHARQMAAHERSIANRNRVLQNHQSETRWLDALEDSISRHAIAAAAARLSFIEKLNRMPFASQEFPPSLFRLQCPIAERLQHHPALQVEDWLRTVLRQKRNDDREKAVTSVGAHRSDFSLYDAATDREARFSSSGQQKVMLLGILLSHARHVAEHWGDAPLVLLDEPLVHLDSFHRAALLESLQSLATTILLTGTDREVFQPLYRKAEFLSVNDGVLVPENP